MVAIRCLTAMQDGSIKLRMNIAIPPAVSASMILISFFLSGGYQFTSQDRHWNYERRKDYVMPNGNILPGHNHLQ